MAQTTAHLAESLHPQPNTGLLESARERLEKAIYDVEAHAPVVAGLAPFARRAQRRISGSEKP